MCKTKNVILEIVEREDGVRSYIMRELPQEAGKAPVTLGVFVSTSELSCFLDELSI